MINLKLVIALLFGITVLIKHVAGGPLCFECQRIPYPRDCDRVRRCSPHERCYTSQYISTSGAIWFDTGCFPVERCVAKRSAKDITYTLRMNNSNDVITDDITQYDDIITCDQCCDGDFCNSHGCGSQPLPPVSTRGPGCFACHQQPTQNSCEIVTTCKHGEQCDTLQALPSLIGRRGVQTKCGGCCDRDYCNQNCTSLYSLPVYSSATASAITSSALTSPPLPRETTSRSTTKELSPTTHSIRTSAATKTSTASSKVSTIHFTSTTTASTIQPTFTTTASPTTLTSSHQVSTTTSQFVDKVSCIRHGYTFYPTYNLCYKLYRVKHTWHQAREACIKEGGDLIVFDNQAERDYFDQLVRPIYANISQYERRFWVGATDQASEQHWLWVDGTPVSKSYFHPNEPNNAYKGEDCGAMTYFYTDDHTWINDDQCDILSDYMCQLKLKSQAFGQQVCKNSDFQHKPNSHLCYKIYKDNPISWQDAEQFCEQKSAHLLILEDKNMENYFAGRHFYNQFDSTYDHRYWLGGNDFQQRHNFTWINGQPLSATLTWNPMEPNNYKHNERCLDFTSQFGQIALNDDDCSKTLYFICQENHQ